MSRFRQNQLAGSTTLWSLSLAVCLSTAAVAEARSASTARAADASAGERLVLNTRQRHALATLFAQLTDAARQLHKAPQVIAAPTSARSGSVEPPEPVALHRPLDRPHTLPTPPLREALCNLPPPATR